MLISSTLELILKKVFRFLKFGTNSFFVDRSVIFFSKLARYPYNAIDHQSLQTLVVTLRIDQSSGLKFMISKISPPPYAQSLKHSLNSRKGSLHL